RTNSNLEKLIAFHFKKVHSVVDRLVRGAHFRTSARSKQLLFVSAIRSYLGCQNSLTVGNRSKNSSTGSVTKDHASRTISIINVFRKNFSADHQGIFDLACLYHCLDHRPALNKAK